MFRIVTKTNLAKSDRRARLRNFDCTRRIAHIILAIENLEVWRAGQVRALCVFDKERIAYKSKVTDTMSWGDIPTCKEEGLDVQYLMLRAMFLPGKVTPDQTAFYVDLFRKLTQTPEYKEYLEKQALKPIFLTGKEMVAFLEEDDKLNKGLMTEAGFVEK